MSCAHENTGQTKTRVEGATEMSRVIVSGGLCGQLLHRKRAVCPALTHRVQHTAVTVFVALCFTVILPLICLSRIPDANDPTKRHDESDERVGRIVRSLSSIRAQEDRGRLHKRTAMLTAIRANFPWLEHNNALPNYFLRGSKRTPESNDAVRQSTVVFVRQSTPAGDVLNSCVETFVNASRNRESGTYSDGNAAAEMTKHFRHGRHSFGSCQNESVPCSYFGTFHDPFQNAVSMYRYCQATEGTRDTICAVVDANHVTLRQWLLHHGSLNFQHLAYNFRSCVGRANAKGSGSLDVLCWNRQKRDLGKLNASDRAYLLDYIIDNLEKWFYVIALDEDMQSSTKLLETAFKLPFSTCASTKNTKTTSSLDNRTYEQKRKEPTSEYTENESEFDDDDNDPEYLADDYSVRMALEADYKIYHRAKEIFRIQKQFVFNTI